MSTTIISNQQAIKFDLLKIIKGYQQDNPDVLNVDEYFESMFTSWNGDYILLIEENYSSNTYPQIPSWYSGLGVTTKSDLICNYINKALTSFEGGSCRYKGSNHTSPENALKRLRKQVHEAVSYDEFLSWSKYNKLTFKFSINKKIHNSQVISDNEKERFLTIFKKLDLKMCGDGDWQKTNITINKTSDILKVIVLTSLANVLDGFSTPCVNASKLTVFKPDFKPSFNLQKTI